MAQCRYRPGVVHLDRCDFHLLRRNHVGSVEIAVVPELGESLSHSPLPLTGVRKVNKQIVILLIVIVLADDCIVKCLPAFRVPP